MPDLSLQHKINNCAVPTFGYRRVNGEIQKDIFDGVLPTGWVDSPAKCMTITLDDVAKLGGAYLEPKRRGRPKGSKNKA